MKYKRKKTNVSKYISQSRKPEKSILKRQIKASVWLLLILFSLPQLGIVKKPVIKSIFTYGSKAFNDVSFSSASASRFLKNTSDYIYSFCFGQLKEKDNTKVMAKNSVSETEQKNTQPQKPKDTPVLSDSAPSDADKTIKTPDLFLPIWPCAGNISSDFGERVHPVSGEVKAHNGVDIATDEGSEIRSCEKGTVEFAGYDDYSGNYISISHTDGYTSLYLHLSKLMVSTGDNVKKGDVIGLAGSTGIATGPHLHFEIKKNGVWQNPEELIEE